MGAAAFPRLAYWLRWPTRLGARGLVVYVAVTTLFLFGFRTFVKHVVELHERAREELRAELGREPTDDEFRARLMRIHEARFGPFEA